MPWDKESGCFESGNWLLRPIEEWSQFWQSCNWYTIHPINIELENDESMGGFEITVIVLGIGLRWRWNYTITERMAKILDDIEGIKSGRIETFPVNLEK